MRLNKEKIAKPLAYQVNDFGLLIGVGRSVIYKMINGGKLRTVMIAGRRVIPASEADRLLSGTSPIDTNRGRRPRMGPPKIQVC